MTLIKIFLGHSVSSWFWVGVQTSLSQKNLSGLAVEDIGSSNVPGLQDAGWALHPNAQVREALENNRKRVISINA